MLEKRLTGSKFRVHFHFKAILQSRTNNHSSGYNHIVHFPLCVHPIHLRPNIRNHTNPNNVHQTVHLILPLQQAFLHSKRQKIVFFHLHYALLSFAASTLIVRLALHHADLFIHEIGVLLRVLRWNQREFNKQHSWRSRCRSTKTDSARRGTAFAAQATQNPSIASKRTDCPPF